MAQFDLNVGAGIHAEIKDGDVIGYENTPIIVDPLSLSYSGYGELCLYTLSFSNVTGLYNIKLLQNGKNSRITVEGTGTCDIILYVEDEFGNNDTDTITITIN